jgi:hypothetical protein
LIEVQQPANSPATTRAPNQERNHDQDHPMKQGTPILPDIPGVLCLVLFLALVPLGGEYLLRCADTLWHIKAGAVMLEQRSLLTHDIFSHTAAGQPWMAHEWLAEIIMALVHQVGGLAGVVIFFALIAALTFWLLMRLARHYLDDLPAIFCGLTALLLAGSHLLARPHLFTWLLGTLTLYILTVRRDKLWLLPLITLAWANLHAGFFFGLLLQTIFIAGFILDRRPSHFALLPWLQEAQKQKKPALILLLSVLAAMINPFGPELFLFPFHVTGEVFILNIWEWLPPNMRSMWYFRFYILLLLVLLVFHRRSLSWTNLLLLLFFIDAAFRHSRHVSLAGIFLTPLLIELLTPWAEKLRHLLAARQSTAKQLTLSPASGPILALVLAAALFSFAGFNQPTWHRVTANFVTLPETFSPAAIDFLAESPPSGKMFNDYSLGGYLIYALNPPQPVFIDGRADMYGEEIFTDYGKITKVTEDTDALLQQYDIDWIIFPWDRPLIRYLNAGGGWAEIYRDDQLAILVRNQG